MTRSAKQYDELLEDALELCVLFDEISPILIQAYLDISYRRASRIFYQLREMKIIANIRNENTDDLPLQIGVVNRENLRLSLVN